MSQAPCQRAPRQRLDPFCVRNPHSAPAGVAGRVPFTLGEGDCWSVGRNGVGNSIMLRLPTRPMEQRLAQAAAEAHLNTRVGQHLPSDFKRDSAELGGVGLLPRRLSFWNPIHVEAIVDIVA